MELQVKGSDIPKPITAWSQLPLNTQCKFTHTLTPIIMLLYGLVKSNLAEWNFSSLTPVQMQVIPAVLKKRDLLVCSSTGSGKCMSRPL